MVISKPSTNYSYPNVFGLRRHKLELMKQILDNVPHNVKLVRLKGGYNTLLIDSCARGFVFDILLVVTDIHFL